MAAQLVFGLIIFLVSYAGTAFLLIEILMWAMGRLDRPKAPAATPIWTLESRLASTLSYQATLGRTYLSESYARNTIEADQFDHPQTSAPLFQSRDQEEKLVPQPWVHCACSSTPAFKPALTICGLDLPGKANSNSIL